MLNRQEMTLLCFIRDYVAANGYGPTYAEMAKALGFRSIGPAQYRLDRLRALGYVERTPGTSRAVRVLRMPGRGETEDGAAWRLFGWLARALAPFHPRAGAIPRR